MPVCVECGYTLEGSETLYTEYSPTNIRLTRCDKCKNVADKYIEYELILVYIDLILHNTEAYRHLFFNRPPFCAATLSDSRLIMLSCLFVNFLVKSVVLHNSEGNGNSSHSVIFVTCVVEHVAFIASIYIALWKSYIPSMHTALFNKFCRKLYLSLAFPEIGKLFAILLQTWDSESILLLFVGMLVISIQYHAYHTVCNQQTTRNLFVVFVCGLFVKIFVRIILHSDEEVKLLGVLL
mmetsp:Transcript_16238/g.24460  ORF Transcript_16238/g.24460 Transcript_16238/m.24460 type:complete len:237 (+) Transcript_16238:127-837(+)